MKIFSKFITSAALAGLILAPVGTMAASVSSTTNLNANLKVKMEELKDLREALAKEKKEQKNTLTAEQRACVAAAITKRDNAVIASLDTYQISWKLALQTRRDALVKAWSLENRSDRIKAQQEAWRLFQNSHRGAKETFRQSRLGAWTTFRTDHKACSPRAAAENMGNSSVDAG